MSAQLTSTTSATKKEYEVANSNEQQLRWRSRAKTELTATSRINMMKRLTKIVSTVRSHSPPLLATFEIPKAEIRRMFTDVDSAIKSWRGVDVHSCKKSKKTFKEYKVTATNWFNRNKAKIYGNYFFCPLVFRHVLQYCTGIPTLTDSLRMRLFIAIFLQIFDGKITFARTKAQPLLPYQTLIQPNEFRKKCKELILFYDLEWNQKDISPSKIRRIYQKDKFRSNKIFHSFINCLKTIQSSTMTHKNYGLFRADNHRIIRFPILKNESANHNRSPQSLVTECADECVTMTGNGLSPKMNELIELVLNDNVSVMANNCPFTSAPMSMPMPMPMPQINMTQSVQVSNVNINGNNSVNVYGTAVKVRYQLLSVHPQLPPIIVSQNVL